jgi:hypothetical protein
MDPSQPSFTPPPPLTPSGPPRRGRKLAIAAVVGLLIIVLAAYAVANQSSKQATQVKSSPQSSPTPSGTPVKSPSPTSAPSPQATPTPVPAGTPTPATVAPTPKPPTPTPTPPPAVVTIYQNGTYSATGHYSSPGGLEALGVTLTVSNDIVTASQVSSGATNPTAQSYQQQFIAGYQSQVVGKPLSAINVTKVSGSSLTPHGFNDAVTQIKSQAD